MLVVERVCFDSGVSVGVGCFRGGLNRLALQLDMAEGQVSVGS